MHEHRDARTCAYLDGSKGVASEGSNHSPPREAQRHAIMHDRVLGRRGWNGSEVRYDTRF